MKRMTSLRTALTLSLFVLSGSGSIAEASELNCGPGRPCPPPPPVMRSGRIIPPPVRRNPYGEPPPVTRGSTSGTLSNSPSAQMRCPPYTAYDVRIGRCVADPYGRRRMEECRPVYNGNAVHDRNERSAVNIVNAALRGLDCGQASDSLRRLSNQVLSMQASGRNTSSLPSNDPRRVWREYVQSPEFWKKVWHHMAVAYQSCNRSCFDDGEAIGQISATAYCSASIVLDGLPGPGYIEQPPLPVCETSIFAGCLKAYDDTAAATPECRAYTSNSFEGIFAEYQSQDCHL
jgi:hypothetical protein